MSDPLSILPPNRTALESTLEQAIRKTRPDLTPIAELMIPDTCPAGLLGWLAWAFSVDVWDPAWPEAVQRDVIRQSIRVHRLKGSRKSVELALAPLGFRIDLTEWWQDGAAPHAAPHTFRLDAYAGDVLGAGFHVDAALQDTVTRLIDNVKPVRSHFMLRLGESLDVTAAARTGLRQRAWRYPVAATTTGGDRRRAQCQSGPARTGAPPGCFYHIAQERRRLCQLMARSSSPIPAMPG